MPGWNPEANDIFLEALESESPADQQAHIERSCGENADLRAQVESLVAASRNAGSFLEVPAARAGPLLATTTHQLVSEKPGTQIGPYKLLQLLGEGGMGVVYMAEQKEPVQRRVALKIIKPGMDTRQVIARFEAERQALAMMDHPNIARVLDAGATEDGRPYFVMELVNGLPVIKYCDGQHLTLEERLKLFVSICQAVQHAHQKGIIHRDLKPSNVLVARYDGQPVPKIIDFGVAKATSQTLTEKTRFTQLGQVVGTLEYMSPEQAEGGPSDIDTRTDVYSLGLLLYELLVGALPFDRPGSTRFACERWLRKLRENALPTLHLRFKALEEAERLTIAQNRRLEPRNLTRVLRGDLNWIASRSLESDRNRRYESPSALSDDIERYLCGEALEAGPPSQTYKLKKFARRHRTEFAVCGLLLGTAVALAVVAARSAMIQRERRERAAATLVSAMKEAQSRADEENWSQALAVLDQAKASLPRRLAPPNLHEKFQVQREDLAALARIAAIRLQKGDLADANLDDSASVRRNAFAAYQEVFRTLGIPVLKLDLRDAGLQIQSRSRPTDLAAGLESWAEIARQLGKWKVQRDLLEVARIADPDDWRNQLRSLLVAEERCQQADRADQLVDEASLEELPTSVIILLTKIFSCAGRGDEVLRLWQQYGRRHRNNFWAAYSLACVAEKRGNAELATRYFTAALALRPKSLITANRLGTLLRRRGRYEEAIGIHRDALRAAPQSAETYGHLGIALSEAGHPGRARNAFQKAVALDPESAKALNNWANVQLAEGHNEKAIDYYRKAIRIHPDYARAYNNLAVALGRMGRHDAAIQAAEHAVRLVPEDACYHHILGNALLEKERFQAALKSLQKSVELPTRHATHYIDLAKVWQRLGDLEKTLDALRKAIELEPDNPWHRWKLCSVLIATYRFEEVLSQLEALSLMLDKEPRAPLAICRAYEDVAVRAIVASSGKQDFEVAVRASQEACRLRISLLFEWLRSRWFAPALKPL